MIGRCKPPFYFAALLFHASAAFSWCRVQRCPTPPRTAGRRRSPLCFGGVQLLMPTLARKTGSGTSSALVYRGIVLGTLQKRKHVRCLDASGKTRVELNTIH